MYKVEFLPIAQSDMVDIVRYISRELSNPSAAHKLSQEFIKAAEQISLFPYSNPLHQPIKPLRHEYRKMMVSNYMMLYWVDEAVRIVTVSRVIYAKRHYERLLQ